MITNLHPSGINIIRKVSIANLKWSRLVIDEIGSDNVELRYYRFPNDVRAYKGRLGFKFTCLFSRARE